MEDGGESGFAGAGELSPERLGLNLPWSEVVVEIEPDFTDGADISGPGEPPEFPFEIVPEPGSLVGVDSGRGMDVRESLPELEKNRQASWFNEVGRAEDGFQAGLEGPADDIGAVRFELRHVQMGVGIHQAPSLRPRFRHGDSLGERGG